jgi:hypothetical protein
MQIPILNGIYTDEDSDFRVAYPKNLIPVPVEHGISGGYLRPADGIVQFGDTPPGIGRGGINWNGVQYRVMGTSLVSIDALGAVTNYGTIPGTDRVTLDYSFDYLSIAADEKLYLFDGATIQQVTDADLGVVLDQIWVDGYFMTTDGANLVVTELADPFSVLPTKYGSSEADPDPVKALLKVRNEPYALNRYTTEVFDNVGGTGFPFQRIDGAQVECGPIGTFACCVFLDAVALVGGGFNEAISVWLIGGGNRTRIATREIDIILSEYSEAQLANTLVEDRVEKGHQQLRIHLPDRTLVYDAAASQIMQEPVWYYFCSDLVGYSQYRAQNLVFCYDKWWVHDPQAARFGYLSDSVGDHWGEEIGWDFGTVIIYNDGFGVIFHEVELVCLSGRAALGDDSTIWTRYSTDGETWSMERGIKAGKQGQRNKRLVWINQGPMEHWRIQQFRGTSKSRLSMVRLEARIEALNV